MMLKLIIVDKYITQYGIVWFPTTVKHIHPCVYASLCICLN